MSLAHRVRWIGRADVRGFWCHAPGCHEFAGNLRAMQTHADLHEGRAEYDARNLAGGES